MRRAARVYDHKYESNKTTGFLMQQGLVDDRIADNIKIPSCDFK